VDAFAFEFIGMVLIGLCLIVLAIPPGRRRSRRVRYEWRLYRPYPRQHDHRDEAWQVGGFHRRLAKVPSPIRSTSSAAWSRAIFGLVRQEGRHPCTHA